MKKSASNRIQYFLHGFRVIGMLDYYLVAEVGRQEEDDIFAVNQAAFTVCHFALIERLVEQVEHIRVRFFHFIEQYYPSRVSDESLRSVRGPPSP